MARGDPMRLFRPNIQKMLKRKDVNGLIRAAADPERGIRLAAIDALGSIGGSRAVEPLIAALKDGSWGIRQRAAKALGKTGDTRAAAPLAAAMRDGKSAVYRAAAEALARIGLPDDPELLAWYLVAAAEWEQVVCLGEAGIEPLVTALGQGEIEAARALGKTGDTRAAAPLTAALRDRDNYLRRAAAEALARIGLPDDPELLAWYAVEVEDWDRVDSLGAAAVAPLIFKLTEFKDIGRGHTARHAARRLQGLYRSGDLSEADKQSILAVRAIMAKPHMDHSEVFEEEDPDTVEHEDYGIGVEL